MLNALGCTIIHSVLLMFSEMFHIVADKNDVDDEPSSERQAFHCRVPDQLLTC